MDAMQKLVIEQKKKRQFHLELNRRSSIRRSQCRDECPCIRSRAPHRNPSSRLGVVFFCTEMKMRGLKAFNSSWRPVSTGIWDVQFCDLTRTVKDSLHRGLKNPPRV
jgi:hypothetical protein